MVPFSVLGYANDSLDSDLLGILYDGMPTGYDMIYDMICYG